MTKEELGVIAEAAREGVLIATKEWLNVREAALRYGVSEWTIRKGMKDGSIPFSMRLRRELIDAREVDRRLKEKTIRIDAEKQMKSYINELTRKKARL
jgi:hypothetical protein